MRKIVITCHTGQCGSDSHEFYEVSDDMTEDDLNLMADECARDNAEMYGIYPESDRVAYEADGDTEDEQYGSNEYSDNIEGYWEDYDPEKHDGFVVGTGVPVFK